MSAPTASPAPSVDRLTGVLESSTGRRVTDISTPARLTGGSSREIWSFAATFDDGETRDLVVRRDPPGEERADGAALETEVMSAARAAGVPVPRLYRPDAPDRDDAGIVMDLVTGETTPARILDRADLAGARAGLAAACGRALGCIHTIPEHSCPSLPVEDRLVQYRATLDRLDRARPVLELAHRWLLDTAPPTRRRTVVHGDFRLGNIAVDADGLTAVLDWESAHIGDPLEDLGWIAVKSWRFKGPHVIGGFGRQADFLDAYADVTGVAIPDDTFTWAIALNTWIWAVGCLQQADRHLSGAQRSIDLAMVGRRVVEIERDLLELMR